MQGVGGGGGSSLVFRGCHLPPGFRFQPTDQEIIVCYLKKKIAGTATSVTSIIADVDIYKFDPWDLPDKAMFGEGEWFFFSPRDRKYPNGARPNRTAGSGYWKATGTDKPILAAGGAHCLGVKKALVFYQGRSPKGSKTEWVMHEYRLLDTDAAAAGIVARPAANSMRLDDWVLCRVRKKGVSLGPADMDDDTSSGDGIITTTTTPTRATVPANAATVPDNPHHHHHQVPDAGAAACTGDVVIDWNSSDDDLLQYQYILAGGGSTTSSAHHMHMHMFHDHETGQHGGGMVPVTVTVGAAPPHSTQHHHHHHGLASVLETIKRNLSIDELSYLLQQPSCKRANCMMPTIFSSSRGDDDHHQQQQHTSMSSSSPTCFSISDTDDIF